eukprot:97724-Rhodomonas_salina.4
MSQTQADLSSRQHRTDPPLPSWTAPMDLEHKDRATRKKLETRGISNMRVLARPSAERRRRASDACSSPRVRRSGSIAIA